MKHAVLRQTVSTGSPWEPIVGYSRAIRVGAMVHVSGSTATNEDGSVVGVGDAYVQSLQALRKIERALVRAGATLRDVVRTRIYVTDISKWQEIGRAHRELLGEVRPACTMVQVSALVDPAMLVEIEAEAIIAP